MEQAAEQRRQAERRRLWDRRTPILRRSGEDRRTHQRRGASTSFIPERRIGPDRRRDLRRSVAERRSGALRRRGLKRRGTPTPYSAEQLHELRSRFAVAGSVSCPACGGRFTLGPTRRTDGEAERLVLCLGCGRAAVVQNSPAARVLVISTVADLRNQLHEMLEDAGHEVVEADDAGVGLEAYVTVPADVVIIDVIATGRVPLLEFLRELRRGFPEAHVVGLAGRPSLAGIDPLEVAEGLGALRSIRVPVDRGALLTLIQEIRG
jgi:CheY-like chemotaxis protein